MAGGFEIPLFSHEWWRVTLASIGDGVIATAQSGIPSDVPAGAVVSGYPAIDNKLWLRCSAIFNKLPELAKALRAKTRQES